MKYTPKKDGCLFLKFNLNNYSKYKISGDCNIVILFSDLIEPIFPLYKFLGFDNDIIVEKASVQRSTTTGDLEIKAPMAFVKPRVDKIKKIEENKKALDMQKKEEERLKKLKIK